MRTADSKYRAAMERCISLFVIWASLGAGSLCSAATLSVSFADPIGDHSPSTSFQIDLVSMTLTFDNLTGAYEIFLRADSSNPFNGDFILNANLINGDISPLNETPAILFDNFNHFSLLTPKTTMVLDGVNLNLLSWAVGDRIATSSTPFGIPVEWDPMVFFSSGVVIAGGPGITGGNADRFPFTPTDYSIVTPLPGGVLLFISGVSVLGIFASPRRRAILEMVGAQKNFS